MLLHHIFINKAKSQGSHLLFDDQTTGRKLTYGRSLIASLILARRFKKIEDGYIGILLPTSAGCGLSIFSTLMAGKTPVILNYSTGAEKNIRYAQDRCGFTAVVTSRTLLKKIECPELEEMIFVEDLLASISFFERIRGALIAMLPAGIIYRLLPKTDENDASVILFTSGSEKAPKAVELTHRNIGSNVEAALHVFDFNPADRFLSILPLFHILGLMTNLWLPVAAGASITTYANPLEFKTVASVIRNTQPTIIIGTPYFLTGYIRQAQEGDYEAMRIAIAGADKVPEWLHGAFEKQDVELVEGYGATETSPVVSVNLPGANRHGSVGRPLPGVEVRIVDVDSGEDLPVGQEGKILVKGDLVMKGYLNDLEETILHIENGWYETGDMGMLDKDGFLWHRGRLKRFVKIGGEMVSLKLIESELEKLLPEEIEYCAVELPDSRKGACIAIALSEKVDEKDLMAKLSKKLPPISLPRRFVVLPEMPKMGSGKVDFRTVTEAVKANLS
jgi:acyl-[acyl-carrier-protein]-phospholipid O-acyltransferase/long-chain-fatty-acid--[acyl-carrier-protein] ligase